MDEPAVSRVDHRPVVDLLAVGARLPDDDLQRIVPGVLGPQDGGGRGHIAAGDAVREGVALGQVLRKIALVRGLPVGLGGVRLQRVGLGRVRVDLGRVGHLLRRVQVRPGRIGSGSDVGRPVGTNAHLRVTGGVDVRLLQRGALVVAADHHRDSGDRRCLEELAARSLRHPAHPPGV